MNTIRVLFKSENKINNAQQKRENQMLVRRIYYKNERR